MNTNLTELLTASFPYWYATRMLNVKVRYMYNNYKREFVQNNPKCD